MSDGVKDFMHQEFTVKCTIQETLSSFLILLTCFHFVFWILSLFCFLFCAVRILTRIFLTTNLNLNSNHKQQSEAYQRHVDVECETIFAHVVILELSLPYGWAIPRAHNIVDLLFARLMTNWTEICCVENPRPVFGWYWSLQTNTRKTWSIVNSKQRKAREIHDPVQKNWWGRRKQSRDCCLFSHIRIAAQSHNLFSHVTRDKDTNDKKNRTK